MRLSKKYARRKETIFLNRSSIMATLRGSRPHQAVAIGSPSADIGATQEPCRIVTLNHRRHPVLGDTRG
jgi:hypothetical protein